MNKHIGSSLDMLASEDIDFATADLGETPVVFEEEVDDDTYPGIPAEERENWAWDI